MSFPTREPRGQMYWLAPGKRTSERHRAFLIYAIYVALVAAVIGGVIATYGVTLQGVLGVLYTVSAVALICGYVAWRNHVDGPRNLLGDRVVDQPKTAQSVRQSGGRRGQPTARAPRGIMPAVYHPVPEQAEFGVGPSAAPPPAAAVPAPSTAQPPRFAPMAPNESDSAKN